jgi:uncharacterized protein (TIGR03435 family)
MTQPRHLTIRRESDKQLGLKLEAQKRPVRTYILDHIDDKPAE